MATVGRENGLTLDAVVLAAGAGSRFGGGKLLAPWREGVLLDGALAAAFAAPARSVSVVWGADLGVPGAAEAFAIRSRCIGRLRLIHAPRHVEGLSASLKAAIQALPAEGDGVFVFLGDMPRIPPATPVALAAALRAGASAAAPVFKGVRGHPVLFGAALAPSLLALTGDRGAGALLDGLGSALALAPAPDDGVIYDIDRPEDLPESVRR